jgi:serine/threonine-protein kinase
MAAFEPAGRKFAQTMLPMGTPGYMSPEQIRACGTVDARTDIWALGCVLSELITGMTAFNAPTLLQLGAAILEREPIPLRKAAPEAPVELEAIVAKCLQKDPEQRYPDVAELAAALYRFGPRRSRISAERCHQVLKGQTGIVIEFNSVPPPSLNGSTPLPVSSMGPTVSSTPVSAPDAAAGAPRSLAAPFRKKPDKKVIAAAAIGVAVLGGIALGLAARGAAKTAAIAPPAAPTLTVPATTPVAAAPLAPAARVAARTAAAPADDAEAATPPLVIASARPHGRPARAQHVASPPPVKQDAPVASAKPKPKRALDDSEPDVGY